MKRFVFALLAVMALSVSGVRAQTEAGTTVIYPRIGVNMFKIPGDEVYMSAGSYVTSKNKVGFTAGVEVEHRFLRYFAASAGLMYSMQGTGYEDSEIIYHDDNYMQLKDVKLTSHYLNLPVLTILYMGNSGFSIKAGVQFGFLMSAKFDNYLDEGSVIDGEPVSDTHPETMTVTNGLNRFDFSLPLGIAYEYRNFSMDLRYNLGLTKTWKFFSKKNRGISLMLGYGFTL